MMPHDGAAGGRPLAERNALILGIGRTPNIASAIARSLAAAGARVLVAGRDGAAASTLAEEIGGFATTCDITAVSDVAALADQAMARLGKLDIAVNAAGTNLVQPFLDVSIDALRQVTDVQFIGTFLFMQAVGRVIADGGSIIQISSVSATALLPNHAAYMATKAAGDVLVRALALELGHRRIRVNSIAPGPTADSPMAQAVLSNSLIRDKIESAIPLGRLGTASDIAEAALWLAGDSSFITGEVLQINGGRAIHVL